MSIYNQYMYSYPHKTAYRPVNANLVRQKFQELQGQPASLYIHIPFCRAKCGYCNLFSISSPSQVVIARYLEAVKRQLVQHHRTAPLDRINWSGLVLGGGTPAMLSPNQLERLLETVDRYTGLTPRGTFSVIELSPTFAIPDRVKFLASCGFTRVSMGVQSFVQEELDTLGRAEPVATSLKALEQLSGTFPICNLDLIYGIPGQTWGSFLYSLQNAVAFQPQELFLYPLYTRPQTPLEASAVDEALCLSLYRKGREYLLQQGYQQVSMRRFVLSPLPHPPPDCGFEQGLALGCGGRSYLGNLHVCEPYAVQPPACKVILEHYLNKKDFFQGLVGWQLDKEEQKRRYVIKNLLHVPGVEKQRYREQFGSELTVDFPLLLELKTQGFLTIGNGRVSLTLEGLARSDRIGPMFISPEVNIKSNYSKTERWNHK